MHLDSKVWQRPRIYQKGKLQQVDIAAVAAVAGC